MRKDLGGNVRVLPASFYARPTLQVARSLLGKYLVRETSAGRRAGRIVEVEAYVGFRDRASHASRGRTKRTEVMFGPPGLAYVYLIYGMYHCLNVVTERADFPAAVLIRAVQDTSALIDGPGRVCRSFQIDRELNYHDLTSGKALWIEDRGNRIRRARIGAFPRIGVDYAKAWAAKPWRFRLKM
ncbi:MAG: DNA-3-methyladenine glycosylase [Nitrospirae bacterium]|nr:MAG: DNA-3-methyladenine glycosylase [Nitrospirota bacterium]